MKNEKRILIVDDDEDILTAGKLLLKRHYSDIRTCNRPGDIPDLLKENSFDIILLDMNFSPGESSGKQGFAWLRRILELEPDALVIMITAHGSVDIAVRAMKHGAADFILKPWENEKVLAVISAALRMHEGPAGAVGKKSGESDTDSPGLGAVSGEGPGLLGESEAMEAVHSIIRRAAPTDANVLILGENGTGKELVARDIHARSLRAKGVFMSIDLGSVPETLFESELFGHKKGAFTGADRERRGRIVEAQGGTLFLDEIGNIPPHLQARLLTVLEQRKVTPLGGNQAREIDVRVIAATNMSPEDLNDEKQFRRDLLFRLNTVEIRVPPLRRRSEDIPKIAAYYAEVYARKYDKPLKAVSVRALEAARRYDWPGNVRALRHAVERAVILSDGPEIEAIDLQLDEIGEGDAIAVGTAARDAPVADMEGQDLHLERAEKRNIEAALKRHEYNISKAAKELGLTRASLYRRMEKYGF